MHLTAKQSNVHTFVNLHISPFIFFADNTILSSGGLCLFDFLFLVKITVGKVSIMQ